MLMRRAKELNVGVREQPENLQLWLDFAAFQDTALPRCRSRFCYPSKRCSSAQARANCPLDMSLSVRHHTAAGHSLGQ